MKSVQVNLGDRSYPIHVKSGLMKQVASILSDQNRGQKWIIVSQYNLMEFFGFDLISLSSYALREIGREEHRTFLTKHPPILIIGDMDLSHHSQIKSISNLLIFPFIIDHADEAPCTVGEIIRIRN